MSYGGEKFFYSLAFWRAASAKRLLKCRFVDVSPQQQQKKEYYHIHQNSTLSLHFSSSKSLKTHYTTTQTARNLFGVGFFTIFFIFLSSALPPRGTIFAQHLHFLHTKQLHQFLRCRQPWNDGAIFNGINNLSSNPTDV